MYGKSTAGEWTDYMSQKPLLERANMKKIRDFFFFQCKDIHLEAVPMGQTLIN